MPLLSQRAQSSTPQFTRSRHSSRSLPVFMRRESFTNLAPRYASGSPRSGRFHQDAQPINLAAMDGKVIPMSSHEKQVTPERIMQLAWGFTAPMIIEAAVKHGIFDAIDAGGPLLAEQVAQRTNTSPRG